MTRKKVKLAFITSDSARKATYKKRKRGMLKKMDELTTLCDVKACAIMYSPYETRPVVWPNPSVARDVITSFQRLPEMEKVKKMVSQEEFLRQRVVKAHEQLKRQQKDNREKEMTQVMYQCLTGKSIQNMSLLNLSDIGWVINQHLHEINKRMETLRKQNKSPTNTTIAASHARAQHGMREQNDDDYYDTIQVQPWSSFMDMIGPTMVHNYPDHPPHHQAEIGGMRLRNEVVATKESNDGSSSDCNNNTNMMVMMMGQFGDYRGLGVNHTLWSNNPFCP